MRDKIFLITESGVGVDNVQSESSVYIGKGVEFEGSTVSSNSLYVAGGARGTIEAKSLNVTQHGRFNGKARVSRAWIDGSFSASIEATDTVTIGETAEVEGNVVCAKIQISKGADIQAKIDCPANSKVPIAKRGLR